VQEEYHITMRECISMRTPARKVTTAVVTICASILLKEREYQRSLSIQTALVCPFHEKSDMKSHDNNGML
jgi:hypothetical protein